MQNVKLQSLKPWPKVHWCLEMPRARGVGMRRANKKEVVEVVEEVPTEDVHVGSGAH